MLRKLFTSRVDDLRGLYTDAAHSKATNHADVPPPDDENALLSIAARWTSAVLRPEMMPVIAIGLLEAGYETPTLKRLAAEMKLNTRADAEPLVLRLFEELGVPYPPKEEDARFWITRQTAREVIAGLRNPWAAASHLELVIWSGVAGSANIQEIFDIHDEIKWDSDRRSMSELSDALVDAFARVAKMHLDGYSPSPPVSR